MWLQIEEDKMNLQSIKTSNIAPDPEQPRKYFDDEAQDRLRQSIKDNGIEHPILVRENGKGFVIIDGERRWRAAKEAGIKEMPCVVSAKDNTLEKQLRSDCLKEGLTVDELDKAIYRYYEHLRQTSLSQNPKNRGDNPYLSIIAIKIGKSTPRVSKAIDRFEFKRDNEEFVKKIEQKHNPEGKKKYGIIDSTIAMTDKLKSKPAVRRAVIDSILNDRTAKKYGVDNESIKKQIDIISKRDIETASDAKAVMKDLQIKEDPEKYVKNSPSYQLMGQYFEFNKFADYFYSYDFESVKENISPDLLKKFIKSAESFLKYLKDMEE